MRQSEIISAVADYYSDKVNVHGPTARGVDWNSTESQTLRFRELMRIADRAGAGFTLNDFGCGYGGLYDHLQSAGIACDYRGFDVSRAMLDTARQTHPGVPSSAFTDDLAALAPADYTVASGIFNVKLATPTAEWHQYAVDTIAQLARLSRCGFAFNMLTSYSDADRMRNDLYYGDPGFFFDHCKRTYSKWVALLHDYGLYEFTILVRLEP